MLMEFVFEVVLILLIGIIGVIGNCALTIMFAKLQKKQLTFHRLMILLSGFDTVYILLSALLFTVPGLSEDYMVRYHPHVVPIAIPVIQVALTGSVYCTTAISIERYLIVCKPFLAASNSWSAKRYIIPILIISIVYNVPRFFELSTGFTCSQEPSRSNETCHGCDYDDGVQLDNVTTDNTSTSPNEVSYEVEAIEESVNQLTGNCGELIYSIELTGMRRNKYYYSIYTIGLNFFFMGLIPFFVLVSSATLILTRLIDNAKESDPVTVQRNEREFDPSGRNAITENGLLCVDTIQNDFSSSETSIFPLQRMPSILTVSKRLKANEIMLARVSLVITFVFIVCHSIRWVPNIYELVQRIKNPDIEWPSWVESFTCVSHFLTVLNSSVHFYIYYFTRNEISSSFNFLKCICKDDERPRRNAINPSIVIQLDIKCEE